MIAPVSYDLNPLPMMEDPERFYRVGVKRPENRISNNQQGMFNVQVRKRFALLLLNLSNWQDTYLGNWTFVVQ
jgi:hypothetical protein